MQKTLITQCPCCDTRFQVTLEQLQVADGLVRCGHCEAIFSATNHLETSLPRSASQVEPSTPPALPTLAREPVLLRALPTRRSPWVSAFWSLSTLFTLAVALGQYAWFERDRLAAEPLLAPLYAPLCQRLPCQLQPPTALDAIISHQLLVRDHPKRPGALTLDLLLENRAAFEQPFPALKLIFQTLDGQPTEARIVAPSAYLDGDFRADALMPRNKTVQLHLELKAPATASPSYQLQLIPAHLAPP